MAFVFEDPAPPLVSIFVFVCAAAGGGGGDCTVRVSVALVVFPPLSCAKTMMLNRPLCV